MALNRPAEQIQPPIELTVVDQCQAQRETRAQLCRIALDHRLEPLHERSGRRRLGILPHQLQEQLHAVAGVGFNLVQPQGKFACFLGPAFEVIDFQQAPPGIRTPRLEAQALVPGDLRLLQPPQPEQGFAPPDLQHGSHAKRGTLDAMEVFQRIACPRQGGLLAALGFARGRPIQENLRVQEIGSGVVGVRPQGRLNDRLSLVIPALLGQRDRQVQCWGLTKEVPGRPA